MPLLLAVARLFGVYAIVNERQCHVYVLFGKVIGILTEPGLCFLWPRLGLKALIVRWMGQCHVTDMRQDQEYLRSAPVNSEEGAPMGIGIWYEMFISDRWPTCSRTLIRAGRWRPTSATLRSDA
jgi:hypothetical protein